MTIEFDYSGEINHLSGEEANSFVKDLDDALPRIGRRGDYDLFIDAEHKDFEVSGWYDDEDGYVDIKSDIEWTFAKYDIDYKGRSEVAEHEPDWDSMPGGYDTLLQ